VPTIDKAVAPELMLTIGERSKPYY